jgi:drug/metabolite transporter (DMT)-like permease
LRLTFDDRTPLGGPLGVGFGVFQVLNARAVRAGGSVYLATFVQLLVATGVFGAIVAAQGRVGQLADVPLGALVLFGLAGMFHFFLGWTTMSQSQKRIGAARTAPLIATSPLFGVLFALVTGELPGPLELVGIVVTVAGAYVVTDPGRSKRAALRDSAAGLATSAAWALSAVFTTAGLLQFDDPLLGVTVSMAAATLAYGAVLLGTPAARHGGLSRSAWLLKVSAAVVVAFATWWRWLGLADAPVGVVLALQLLTVPTVLALVALRPGAERLTGRVLGGSAIVLGGVAVLVGVG